MHKIRNMFMRDLAHHLWAMVQEGKAHIIGKKLPCAGVSD